MIPFPCCFNTPVWAGMGYSGCLLCTGRDGALPERSRAFYSSCTRQAVLNQPDSCKRKTSFSFLPVAKNGNEKKVRKTRIMKRCQMVTQGVRVPVCAGSVCRSLRASSEHWGLAVNPSSPARVGLQRIFW